MYYLQSRYYDPTTCRFINADFPEAIGAALENLAQYNLFTYCFNHPSGLSDRTGAWPKWLKKAVAAVAAAAVVVVAVAVVTVVAPAAVCSLTLMATEIGVSYGVAHVAAATTVAVVSTAATAYAADDAYAAISGESLLLDTVFAGNEDIYNLGREIVSFGTMLVSTAASLSPGICFVGGTIILTDNGETNIEELVVDDLVWAWNEETGEVALKRVIETYENQTSELVHIFVCDEEIICTPRHPFYSPVKGWTDAVHLRAGDILVLVNGEYVVVERIQHEILEAPITVYNFQVEGFHTYYVSYAGVLVHNDCGKKPTSQNQMQKQVETGQAPSSVVRVDPPHIPNVPNNNRIFIS